MAAVFDFLSPLVLLVELLLLRAGGGVGTVADLEAPVVALPSPPPPLLSVQPHGGGRLVSHGGGGGEGDKARNAGGGGGS